jgi:hypothetical protein
VRSDAWLRFENEEQDRKVYFFGCDEVTELSSRRSQGLMYVVEPKGIYILFDTITIKDGYNEQTSI